MELTNCINRSRSNLKALDYINRNLWFCWLYRSDEKWEINLVKLLWHSVLKGFELVFIRGREDITYVLHKSILSNSKIAVKAKISHSQNTNHFLWNMESTHAKAYHTYQTTTHGSVHSKLRRTKQNNLFPYACTLFSTTTWQNVGPMKIVMGYSYVVLLSSTKLNHFLWV